MRGPVAEHTGNNQAGADFFILFSGSGCNLNLQRARLQDFSFFSFNIFFKHPIMDVACASFWTLIMRK